MKVLKIEQNSEEWLEYRKGKSGGSEFKDLWIPGLPLKGRMVEYLEKASGEPLPPADKKASVDVIAGMLEPRELAQLKLESDKKRRYYEIIAEAVARPITPNDYVDQLNGQPFSMMARGHILENEALAMFEDKYVSNWKTICDGNEVYLCVETNPGVWESDDSPNIYISPDGAVIDEEENIFAAIEVKCPESWVICKAYLENDWLHEYEPQVIKYFVVNEKLEKLYFLLYTDVIPGLELQVFEIQRGTIADRIEEAKVFEEEAMKLVERDINKIKELSF